MSKVLTEFERQKDQNNAGYAEQAHQQISQIHVDILVKTGVVAPDDGLAQLLVKLYLEGL